MTSLGQFGTTRPPAEGFTFDYFDSTLRVHPDLSDLDLLDFVQMAGVLESDEVDGMAALHAVMSMLRRLVHPEDFDGFWALAKANRQTIEDLTELAQAVMVGVTERPTEQPSDSSDGQSSIAPSSTVVSSSPVTRLESAGRPDLALVVHQAQEFQDSQAS